MRLVIYEKNKAVNEWKKIPPQLLLKRKISHCLYHPRVQNCDTSIHVRNEQRTQVSVKTLIPRSSHDSHCTGSVVSESASYFKVVVTYVQSVGRTVRFLLWVEKEACKSKEKWFLYKLMKQIVPLGTPPIDEHRSRMRGTSRQASLRMEVRTSAFRVWGICKWSYFVTVRISMWIKSVFSKLLQHFFVSLLYF